MIPDTFSNVKPFKDFFEKRLEHFLLELCKGKDKDLVRGCLDFFSSERINFPYLPIIPLHKEEGFSYRDTLIYSLYYYRTIAKQKAAKTQDAIEFKDSVSQVSNKYFPFIKKTDIAETNRRFEKCNLISRTIAPFYVLPPKLVGNDNFHIKMPSIFLITPKYILSYKQKFILSALYTIKGIQKYCKDLNKTEMLQYYLGARPQDQKDFKILEKLDLLRTKNKNIYLRPKLFFRGMRECPHHYFFGKSYNREHECEDCENWENCEREAIRLKTLLN